MAKKSMDDLMNDYRSTVELQALSFDTTLNTPKTTNTGEWFDECCDYSIDDNRGIVYFRGMYKKDISTIRVPATFKGMPVYLPPNCSGLFKDLKTPVVIDLSEVSGTEYVHTMDAMFAGCTHLGDINFGTNKYSSVRHTNSMFDTCKDLAVVNMQGFDVSKIESFDNMFEFSGISHVMFSDEYIDNNQIEREIIDFYKSTNRMSSTYTNSNSDGADMVTYHKGKESLDKITKVIICRGESEVTMTNTYIGMIKGLIQMLRNQQSK